MKFAELPYETNRVDPVQYKAIEQQMQHKLMDTLMLNELLSKQIKQNGTAVDTDDVSRLLDGTAATFHRL